MVKNLPADAGDTRDAGLIPGLGRSPGEGNGNPLRYSWASLVVQMNLTAIQEIWVPSLGQEDPLEEGMATHPSILAWRSPWTEEPGGLQSVGSQSRTRLWLTTSALSWESPRTEELGSLWGLKESGTSEQLSTSMMLSVFFMLAYKSSLMKFLFKVFAHFYLLSLYSHRASLIAQLAKNPHAVQETLV